MNIWRERSPGVCSRGDSSCAAVLVVPRMTLQSTSDNPSVLWLIWNQFPLYILFKFLPKGSLMATQLPNARVRCWCSQASGILIPSLSHTHFNYEVSFFLWMLVWSNYKSLIIDSDPQNVYLGPSYNIKAKYNISSCLKIERFFQCHKMVCWMLFWQKSCYGYRRPFYYFFYLSGVD